MNEPYAKILEQLAQQLGTSSQYLWGILIKQAFVDGMMSLSLVVFTTLYCIITYKWHIKLSNDGRYKDEDYDDKAGSIMSSIIIAMMVIGFLLIMASLLNIENIFNGLINPEYWALDRILNAIK